MGQPCKSYHHPFITSIAVVVVQSAQSSRLDQLLLDAIGGVNFHWSRS